MTTAKELGTEGLEVLIGKKVVLKYPKTEYHRSFRWKGIITKVHEKHPQSYDRRFVEFEDKGLQWVWDETDISEVRPNRIEQTLQRIRRALGSS